MPPTHSTTEAPAQPGQARRLFLQALRSSVTRQNADALATHLDTLADDANSLADLARQYAQGETSRAELQGEAESMHDTLVTEWGWDS
jgi:hypothetical protein